MMQTCKVCKHKFSWKQIFKSLLFGNQPITCNECGTVFRINSRSKYIQIYFVLGLALILKLYGLETPILVASLLAGVAIFSIIFPFMATYQQQTSNDK